MDEPRQNANRPRRAALALAAALAATALTGGAAVTGLTRHAQPHAATPVVRQAPAVQAPGPTTWEVDD